MSAQALRAELHEHGGATALLVLLHGHGDDPAAQLRLAHRLDPDRRRSWLVPTGPTTTPDGPAWFPGAPGDEGPPLGAALAALDECVERAALGLGADLGRTVVAGFSQGAATALALACREAPPWRPAGVVGLAAWLPGEPDVAWDLPGAAATCFLLGHGEDDPVVDVQLGRGSARALARAGAPVVWRAHPGAHVAAPADLAAGAAWIDELDRGERPAEPPG